MKQSKKLKELIQEREYLETQIISQTEEDNYEELHKYDEKYFVTQGCIYDVDDVLFNDDRAMYVTGIDVLGSETYEIYVHCVVIEPTHIKYANFTFEDFDKLPKKQIYAEDFSKVWNVFSSTIFGLIKNHGRGN